MLKIITLAVVVFAVILLHGVYGGVHRRDVEDGLTTKRPKLIRVPLKRYDPVRSQTLDVAPVSRPKRHTPDKEGLYDDLKRGPLNLESPYAKTGFSENSNDASDDSMPSEEVSRDVKGFEAREQEEKLAENEGSDIVDDQVPEMTEGRAPTDDEKERFDVESSTPKSMKRCAHLEEPAERKLL